MEELLPKNANSTLFTGANASSRQKNSGKLWHNRCEQRSIDIDWFTTITSQNIGRQYVDKIGRNRSRTGTCRRPIRLRYVSRCDWSIKGYRLVAYYQAQTWSSFVAFEIGTISVEAETSLDQARAHIQRVLAEHPCLPYEPDRDWRFLDCKLAYGEGRTELSHTWW